MTPISRSRGRRTLRLSASTCVLACGLAGSAPAQVTPAQGAPASSQPPAKAADFVQSIGMGVHLGASNGPYGDLQGVLDKLAYLGVRHVRDSVGGLSSPVYKGPLADPRPDGKLRRLTSAGIGVDATVGYDLAGDQAKLKIDGPYLEMVEGPNEPDYHPHDFNGMTGIPAAAAVQKQLAAFARSEPALKGKAVANISIGEGHLAMISQAGDLSAFADYANVHAYPPHGLAPFVHIPVELGHTEDAAGKPIIVTETGYATDFPGGPPGARLGLGHSIVSEDAQAKYGLDVLLDDFKAGVIRTYLYELLDEAPDPSNTNAENHFGFYRVDGSPKPAAGALHGLVSILSAPAPGRSPTAPPNWRATQARASEAYDLRKFSLLLRKDDGAVDLIVWAEPPLWTAELTPAPPPAANRTIIELGRRYQSVKVFDPLGPATPLSVAANVDRVSVDITDHPIVVELAGS